MHHRTATSRTKPTHRTHSASTSHVRPWLPAVVVLFLLGLTGPAWAQPATSYALPADPVLSRLITESLSARPEIREGEAIVRARSARVPQAGAMPDPMLQVGVQNDGFTSWEVGRMPSSYYSVMASQTFPWPGKLGLAEEIADLDVRQSKRGVARLRLTTEADVRRLYVSLVLVRDRLALLDRLVVLWGKSSDTARAVYEAGGGSQSDLLRVQLELNRLEQRRINYRAEERTLVQGLNRLRGHILDEAIVTTVSLTELGVPTLLAEKAAVEQALAESPELAAARISVTAADRSVALDRKSYYPDLTVSAGIMPRGGDFPPMWLLTVGGTIPVWAGSKQNRAVEEDQARAAASRLGADAVEQVLRLRVHERLTALSALLDTIRIYTEGLLVQSRATAESTLAQYQVGRVSFASVLDANAGVLSDEDGYLVALADAHRLAIATYEMSLDPVASPSGAVMSGQSMPGRAAMNSAPATSGATAGLNGNGEASAGTGRSMSSGM